MKKQYRFYKVRVLPMYSFVNRSSHLDPLVSLMFCHVCSLTREEVSLYLVGMSAGYIPNSLLLSPRVSGQLVMGSACETLSTLVPYFP